MKSSRKKLSVSAVHPASVDGKVSAAVHYNNGLRVLQASKFNPRIVDLRIRCKRWTPNHVKRGRQRVSCASGQDSFGIGQNNPTRLIVNSGILGSDSFSGKIIIKV